MEHASKALTTLKSKAISSSLLFQTFILKILLRSDRQIPPQRGANTSQSCLCCPKWGDGTYNSQEND